MSLLYDEINHSLSVSDQTGLFNRNALNLYPWVKYTIEILSGYRLC